MSLPSASESQRREFGPQPIAAILQELGLRSRDLVNASTEQLTYKMVSKACRGRWLSNNVRGKVLRALNKASGGNYTLPDLFNYS
ncbi:MAG: hypothetical protein GX902_04785 [Lentisphaerae bacterium]|jgi:hypothetical protein|nr:hypothetical protein [Lentisphaerota bacterium]